MMTSKILKSLNFTKTPKSRYIENETLFFLQIKKLITHQRLPSLVNSLVAEVTCNSTIGDYILFEIIIYCTSGLNIVNK